MSNNFCQINRWEVLKNQLNNILWKDFLASYRQTPGAILLDVRTPEEYAVDHLPNALNMDYLGETFLDKLDQLDTQKTYFVYCRSGRRSIRACTLMRNAGFEQVNNLDGGMVK